MSAVVARDRDALRAEIDRATLLLLNWGAEVRRRRHERHEFEAMFRARRSRPESSTSQASEAVNVFHRKRRPTRKELLKQSQQDDQRHAAKRARKAAKKLALRGSGPIRKCQACQRTIYRGEADTCGCRPCAHCTRRFRGAGFKCQSCKDDPALITARGTQSRGGPGREPQLRVTLMSPNSVHVDELVSTLESWQQNRIRRRYDWQQDDFEAAQELRVPVARYIGEVRSAVEAFAAALANSETASV